MLVSRAIQLLLIPLTACVGGRGRVHVEATGSSSSLSSSSSVTVDLEVRQEAPLIPLPVQTSSSSYDYWWPYPPGVFAPPPTSTSASTPTPSTSAVSSTGSDTSINKTTFISSTSNTPSSSISIAIPTSPSNSSSTHPTTTITTTTTTTTTPRRASPPIPWIVPVLVGFGVLSTGLSLWFCYGILDARRGPRPRASSLEPGPRYAPGTPDHDAHFTDMMEKTAAPSRWSRLQSNRRSLSRAGTRKDAAAFSWPDIALPTTQNININMSKGYFEHGDRHIITPLAGSSPDPLSLLSLDEEEEEEEEEEDMVPYDSLRHKSIRRDILERLKFGTQRRPRSRSVKVDDDRRRRSASAHASASKQRRQQQQQSASTSKLSSSSFRRVRPAHARADSDFLIENDVDTMTPERSKKTSHEKTEFMGGGSGFRIIEEHLDAMWRDIRGVATRGSNDDDDGDAEPMLNTKGFENLADDPYTPLPVRKAHSKTTTTTPRKGGTSTVTGATTPASTPRYDNGLPRVDSSILPQSPPQITSPELESQLLFAPSIMGRPRRGSGSHASTMQMQQQQQQQQQHGRQGLGRVRTGSSELQSLGSMSPSRSTSDARVHARGRPRDRLVKGRLTPAERHAARRAALTKVDEIVSRSWSQRDVVESEGVRNAT